MKRFRHILTVFCGVAALVANAGEELAAKAKGAAIQPTNTDLQLLQGTWEGVALTDQGSSKKPDSRETSKRKPGEIDLDVLKTGVFETFSQSETPPQSHQKITLSITGDSLYFHRDTNFWFQTTIILPAGKAPKQFHATIKDCPPSQASSIGQVVVAIFKIEDGTLTLATGNGDGEAPKNFEATGDNGPNRYELRKVLSQKKVVELPKLK